MTDADWTVLCDEALTADWLAALLPSKSPAKLAAWLKVLVDEELCSVAELQALSDEDWAQLDLPLSVKRAIRDGVAASVKKETAATAQESTPESTEELQQLDCIVLDISGSMRARSVIDEDKTREDVSKMLFHSLVDKLVALELGHAVGLVAFGELLSTIPITRQYERFHDELGRLDANQSRTRLYDAVLEASRVLQEYEKTLAPEQKARNLTKRIFVLTDGEDNASSTAPWQLAQHLQTEGIVLDAIAVAGPNATLQALTTAAGGLSLDICSIEQVMGLFEGEPVLHTTFREASTPPPAITSLLDFSALVAASTSAVRVVEVKAAVPSLATKPVMTTQQALAQSPSTAADKRVLKEFKDITEHPTVPCTAHISADNIRSWKIILDGPSNTPYEHGRWLITLEFPQDYPFKPPRLRFVTPIYHCNVSSAGGVCLDILKDQWSPALTASKVITSIAALLSDPNGDDPLDAFKGQLCRDNRKAYEDAARNHTTANASMSWEDMAQAYNLL